MRGRRKRRVIVAAGLATLVLAAGCTGLGVEVPSGSVSESSAPAVTEPPSESESAPMSESPAPSETPSSGAPSTSGEPPLPIKEGFDLSDPAWGKVKPPAVMQGISNAGLHPKIPDDLSGGYKLAGAEQPAEGEGRLEYKREGDSGFLQIRLKGDPTFPPAGWSTAVSTMTNPRPIGAKICYEWEGSGVASCMAFTEDIFFHATYGGIPEEMNVDQLAPLLDEFVRKYANR